MKLKKNCQILLLIFKKIFFLPFLIQVLNFNSFTYNFRILDGYFRTIPCNLMNLEVCN